ncbi:MAG TPA: hypothetical protein VKE74_13805 [Gemmataceae bacterium]|nr:hypothetical protein [Gemmataceae bacterium]
MRYLFALTFTLIASAASAAAPQGFRKSPWFGEWVHEEWVEAGVRVVANAPATFDPDRPTRLVIYATPNGNTIEQTLGCGPAAGLDWHFDIQHVAAQVRRLREVSPGENIVLACVEAEGLSWPAWRRKHPDGATRVRKVVETLRSWLPGKSARVTLAGHSGGGSFLFAFLDAADTIPDEIERFVFLDANYGYSDADKHGDKLLGWLKGDRGRRLVVIAYDDRNVMLNGKLVVGPTGGTFRATERMRDWFTRDFPLAESKAGGFVTHSGLDGRAVFRVHTNPDNKILHTALVGEMNGLLQGLTEGNPKPGWGTFGGPRAYTKWAQPAPGIPSRPADAPGGSAFMAKLADLTPAEREEMVAAEFCQGNVPDFLRTFCKVTIRVKEHTATVEVMPDYLAVGTDTDFVRVPMTPMTAARIADAYVCALPTRKLVDEVYRTAAVKLEPKPMTEAREAVGTFIEHNAIIEKQRAGKPLGELVAGIKKDVVVTNRLAEKPNRVAIYGWHKPDDSPIQPLTIVHRDTYVDYSHGVRLMKRTVEVDGKPRDLRHVLYDPDLCVLLSDEGPLTRPTY